MRFKVTAWESIGPPGISSSIADICDLSLSSIGVPYVAYEDSTQSDKVTVMKTSFDP